MGITDVTAILQIFFDMLSLGSLYALGALGIALIFGVMRLVNFAHGDYIAFSVFAMLWPSIDAAAIVFIGNLPTVVLIPLVLAIGAGLSVLSELLVFRRFRNANPATMMIASFALGFVIKYILLMLYSSRPKSIDLWSNVSLPVEIFGARIPLLQVITICTTVVALLALTAFLKRTRFGLEMRAAAENFTMARMLGVRANHVIMFAFALSGVLAAAVGLILATQTGTADIQMGVSVMLVAFIATVIGGLGSLPGAVIAGFLIGGATVLMQVVLPVDARPFRDAFVYGAVIVTLIWRPNGLFAPKSAKQRV
jgi:branched-chain amino acid transport system permease protein